MVKQFIHEPKEQRYSLKVDERVASVADYLIQNQSVLFTHTFTDPAFRGKGLADEIVRFAVDDVEANTALRVVPMCSYVVEWFAQHPERAALLVRKSD